MSDVGSNPTPLSLLQKLCQPVAVDYQDSWRRFVHLYTPLLYLWARRLGASGEDAADLVQEVFGVLSREMPAFAHDPGRRFRGWLWTILRNRWHDHLRQRATAPLFADPQALAEVTTPDPAEAFSEAEYRAYLIARVLEVMRAELPDLEWRACHEYVIRGRAAREVAGELGMTVNQVYLAKSRTLRRVREELEGLLD